MRETPAPPTRRQTVEQERAAYALKCVRAAKQGQQAHKYLQEVRGLPTMILVNGLGQTLAFLRAKGKGQDDPKAACYRAISGWAAERGLCTGDLLDAITEMDVATYRLAQRETLAMLVWLKRFAEAEIEEKRS